MVSPFLVILLLDIGNGEETVFDGFACRPAAFEGDEHQAAVVDDARGVEKLLAATKGGFAHGHLVLVDIAYHLIGVSRLGYHASWTVGAAVITHPHATLWPICSGGIIQLTVTDMGVCAIADKTGAINRSALRDEKVGTGV